MIKKSIVEIQDLEHVYMKGTPFEHIALSGIHMTINKGECIAIIGHTGSGKSTLIQHFNGLLPPQKGKVIIDGEDLSKSKADIKRLRRKVGLVFQNPESQIFEKLIGDDIAYGPLKMGLPLAEVRDRVKWAMEMVGLSFEKMTDRPTYALSGGQKRKVALAGVLALRPDILVLDEPTAGLDPRSKHELLKQIKKLNREENLTVVFISHNLEEVAYLADRLYVLVNGKNLVEGSPKEIFGNKNLLEKHNIGTPETVEIMYQLQDAGFMVDPSAYEAEGAAKQICSILESKGWHLMASPFEFTKNITIGQYIPTGSFIHKLDSSFKLFGFAVLLVSIAICDTYIGNIVILGFSILLFSLSRIPIQYGLSGVKPAIPFVLILAFLQLLFSGEIASEGTVYFEKGFILITSDSLRLVIVSAMRFIEIIFISSILTLSTSTTELTYGMERLLRPLKYFKFPVHEFSLIITIAIRFVPTFAMEMEKLMKAQASRGAEFGMGQWWQVIKRTKDMFPIIIPLFNSAMERAEDLVLAMESRCYSPGQKRTNYRTFQLRPGDIAVLAVTILFSLFIIIFPFPY